LRFSLDTPGIRNFGLFGVNTQEIGFYFRDIRTHSPRCDYRDCSHRREQGCAVRAAVDPSRLRSYELLFAEVERDEA
jgi:ribosome biogenesis GTPase